MRAYAVLWLVLVVVPAVASAQTAGPWFSVQAAAGPTLHETGHTVSAAVGFSPTSRVTVFVDVHRSQLSSRVTRTPTSVSRFRGGTMTAVSGEVRVGFLPAHRWTPYALAGAGRGESQPNVNEDFPNPVTHDARFIFFGGGVHVPLRSRLSVFGDVRLLVGSEGNVSLLAMLPVRLGLAWRF